VQSRQTVMNHVRSTWWACSILMHLTVVDDPYTAQLANSMHAVQQTNKGLMIGNKPDECCLRH